MKYTLTITPEDISYINSLSGDEQLRLLVNLNQKLNGKDVAFVENKDSVHYARLKFSPIKKQSLGTADTTAACCARLNKNLGLEGRRGYRPNSIAIKSTISARIADGYELEDFIEVIDKKCAEWKNTEQEKYLRPETLFGNKFSGYLAQRNISSDNAVITEDQMKNIDYEEGL